MSEPPQEGRHALVGRVADAWPPSEWRSLNVVVALSGGADSVALLRALSELKQQATGPGKLIAAHFNHGLRGDASDADERAVRQICTDLGVELTRGRATNCGDSEEAARDARYAFLRRAAADAGARFIATGHTCDDQAETVLLRVLRGTGVAGLAGIPARRDLGDGVTVCRPLLAVERLEIEAYLAAIGQTFRHDQSNDDDRFNRNWIRTRLLPLVQERMGASVSGGLVGLAEQAAELQAWLQEQAAVLCDGAIVVAPGASITIDAEPMQAAPAPLTREACRIAWREAGWREQAMGRRQWRQIDEFIRAAEPAPITLPGGIRARREGRHVVLAPIG